MQERRYILAGYFIDGLGGEIGRVVWLAVENGIIVAVGKKEELPRWPDAPVDDLSHCTLLPALVDCSVYLGRNPAVSDSAEEGSKAASQSELVQRTEQHLRYCQIYGVLGLGEAELGQESIDSLQRSPRNDLVQLRLVPELRPSRQGSGEQNWPEGTYLKICLSPSIDAQSYAHREQQELSGLTLQAGKTSTVVLANGREAVAAALAAGCAAIEQGYQMGEDNLREMAERNVLWIPSVLRAKNAWDGCRSGGSVSCRFSQRYVAPGQADPLAERYWQQILAEQLAQLSMARQLGVRTAVGSGAGCRGLLHGESVTEEVKLFLQAGYSLSEALACASTIGADFLGLRHLGPLTAGRAATFLVTRGAASQLPRKLGFLEHIYIEGRPSPHFSKYPQAMN